MTTMDDIARIVGVSKATVSNVFTKKKRVSEKISKRVLEVCKQINYYPNIMASGLVTKKTNIIGLLLENKDEYMQKKFYIDMINGVTSAAAKQGYRVLLDRCTNNKEQIHNRLTRSDPIEGSIIMAPVIDDVRISEMVENNIPFVLIGRASDENDQSVLQVDIDNIDLTYKTTTHLLELGHKRIGFLTSEPNMTITFDRLKGYINALADYNISFDPSLVYNTDNSAATGKLLCKSMLDKNPDVTAIITSSDEVASGVYEVLFNRGFRIPDDFSVAALGGEDFTDVLKPKLTNVLIDFKEIGYKAFELLFKRIKNEPIKEKRVIMPIITVEGESCDRCKNI